MIEQINNISMAWWGWMSQMFWQVGLLIILVACIDTVIKKWAWPQLRYALWLLVLIKLVIPPSYSVPGSLTGRLRPVTNQLVQSVTTKPAAPVEDYHSPYIIKTEIEDPIAVYSQPKATVLLQVSEPVTENLAEPVVAAESEPTVSLIWQGYAMAVWLLGMLVLGLWLALRLHGLRKGESFKGSARPVPESFEILMLRCAQRLKLARLPNVVVTDKVVCPAVFGLLRPTLLIPRNYLKSLTRKDVEHMLLHELAHIKRGDTLVHGFYMILQIVYWFNPLLWLARRQLHHLRELCCDATVARLLKSRTCEYRETIIDVARRYLTRPVEPGLGLLGLFEDSNRLLVRLNWLEKESWRYPKMKKLTVIVIIALMLSFVLPMAIADSEPSAADRITAPEQTSVAVTQDDDEMDEQFAAELEGLDEELQQFQEQNQKLSQEQQNELSAIEKAKQKLAKFKEMQKTMAMIKKNTEMFEKFKDGNSHYSWAVDPNSAQFRKWREQMQNWQENVQMKQWQKEMKQWKKEMMKWRTDLQHSAGMQNPAEFIAEKISEMPTMPPLPQAPDMPPMPPVPEGAEVSDVDNVGPVSVVSGLDAVDVPVDNQSSLLKPAKENIEISKDDEGRYVAETEMDFISKVKPNAKIIIRNNVGGVVVSHGKDDKCHVRAIIKAKAETEEQARQKAEQISMNTHSSDEEFYLKPVKSGEDNWNNLNVDLIVIVPVGSRPDISTSVGGIRLNDITGQVKGETNVGSIKAVGTSGEVSLTTKVGSIDFTVPKDLSARLEAKTQNGSIKSDLPMDIQKKNFIASEASAVYGEGKGNIVLKTNVGSIKIRNYGSSDDAVDGQVSMETESSNGTGPAVARLLSSMDLSDAVKTVKSINEKAEGNRKVIERIETSALPFSAGSMLEVANEDGSITVTGSDTDECRVVSTFTIKAPTIELVKEFSKKVIVQMVPTSKGLSVKAVQPDNTPRDHSASVDMEISIPRNESLTVRNEDGDIKVTNLNGNIKIGSEDGDIECKGIVGDINMNLEDGDIDCENITGDIDLSLEDGNIDIKKCRMADCRISIEDGNVDCEDVTGNFNIEYEDGNVTVNYAEGASDKYTFDVRGEDGEVAITNGVFTDCTVRMESGTITCEKVGGSLDFVMEEGKVAVNYADNVPESCKVNVKLEEGSIRFSAPAGMFPADAPANAKKKDEGAEWKTEADGKSVHLKVDEGSIKVDKR